MVKIKINTVANKIRNQITAENIVAASIITTAAVALYYQRKLEIYQSGVLLEMTPQAVKTLQGDGAVYYIIGISALHK